MKRITIIIMALLCGAFLFAETGYNGLQWGDESETVIKKKNTDKIKLVDDENFVIEQQKNILGEKTTLNYIFEYNTAVKCFLLTSISYEINKSKIQELEKIINKKPTIYSANISKEELEEVREFYETNSTITLYHTALAVETGEALQEELIVKKKDPAQFMINCYDYNDDTRLYLFENIIKDKAVVVYVPHEQDY